MLNKCERERERARKVVLNESAIETYNLLHNFVQFERASDECETFREFGVNR